MIFVATVKPLNGFYGDFAKKHEGKEVKVLSVDHREQRVLVISEESKEVEWLPATYLSFERHPVVNYAYGPDGMINYTWED